MGQVKERFMLHCQLWADELNRCYDLHATDAEVAFEVMEEQTELANKTYDSEQERKEAFEYSLMGEIEAEAYTDTSPRERMANLIAKRRIGMKAPCYGDSHEYKAEYHSKMLNWLLENDRLEKEF